MSKLFAAGRIPARSSLASVRRMLESAETKLYRACEVRDYEMIEEARWEVTTLASVYSRMLDMGAN